tara:strand:- start:8603 stop:9652 length:1050 start_codon:yes stop_codon:yes gene_type:complete
MSKIVLNKEFTIKKSISRLEKSKKKILFFINKKNEIIGSVTDGDIRRAILNNFDLNSSVEKIITRKFIYLNHNSSKKEINETFEKKKITALPLLKKKKLVKIIYKSQTKKNFLQLLGDKKNFDVVIMAGGYGTRLLPLTKKTPKCLIQINKKDKIIDLILQKYIDSNLRKFYFITYHLSKKIELFLKKNYKQKINFKIIKETKKLGTAGGLQYLKKINTSEDLIVTNSDVISNIDLEDLKKFHLRKKSDVTVVTKTQNLKLDFGQINNLSESLIGIEEKPVIQYVVNAGIYIFKKKLLKNINTKIDIPEFLNSLKKKKYKIKVYHLFEEWYDIGTIAQLNNFKKKFKKL